MVSLIYTFTNLHSKMVQIFDETVAVRDDRKCFYATPFSSTEQGMYTEGMGAQISISRATTTGRLNFVTWRVIIFGFWVWNLLVTILAYRILRWLLDF
jgi:hypothetical protein